MKQRLRKRVGAAIGLAAAALVATTGVAIATTLVTNQYTDADGRFHACVQNENGNVRIVVPDAVCREYETAIDWNQAGPAGAQGPPGPKGDPGAGIAALNDLDGLPCKVRDRDGTVVLASGDALGPAATAYTVWCLRPDEFEPNNDRATAADVTSLVSSGAPMGFPRAGLSLRGTTLFPAGDEDWFVVHATAFQTIMAPTGARLDVYRDGEVVADDLELFPPDVTPPRPSFFQNTIEGPHEWEFHFTPTDSRPAAYFFTIFG